MNSSWPGGGAGEMLSLVTGLVDDLEAAAHLPGLDSVTAADTACRRLVLCGMGGSAIAGDLVQPLLDGSGRQLTVRRDYGLPAWTAADDLVIAASYSGNTEETLAGLADARARGCPVVGITSGGELEAAALAEGGFPRVKLPAGLPPRAALGHGLGALLHVLHRLGVIGNPAAQIAAAAAGLRAEMSRCLAPWTHERYAPDGTETDTIAPGELAGLLADRIPVLYTAGAEAHAVGLRWKAQLNENAKIPALAVAFPELDHNDLVGWDLPESLRERFVLVILESGITDPRDRIRVDATRQLLADEFSSIHRIVAPGDSALARILALVQYGDFLSCHVAHRRAVDPMPVERIENLKTILSRGQHP
jgi:glucose/mannose-6-phosphate isomerase